MGEPGPLVVCAGGAVLDLKFHLDAPAVAETSNPATMSTSPGGVARNVAETLAVLLAGSTPVPAAPRPAVELVCAIGDDEAGTTLLAHLRSRGVGVGQVRVLAGAASARYVAVLQPGGELAIGVAAMGILERVDPGALDAAWPAEGWLFCDANLSIATLEHAVRRARVEGTALAVDAVSTPKVVRLPADLHGIRLLSCNVDEARAWLAHHGQDASGAEQQLAVRLRAAGASAVLLTRGAVGVVVADGDGVHELPAEPADVVDVTGAGDALIAGTLAVLVQGYGPPYRGSDPRHVPSGLLDAVRAGIRLAARTVASPHSVLPLS